MNGTRSNQINGIQTSTMVSSEQPTVQRNTRNQSNLPIK